MRGTVSTMNYISEYKDSWPEEFNEIARFLGTYLPLGIQIHHVGSTSIPGMPAKDIIDIDIECSRGSIHQIIAHLAEAGYEHLGDQGIPTREAFHPCDDSAASRLRSHHLYACEADSPELHRHTAFRDYLLANAERAEWLAIKKRCADDCAKSRDAYIENKAASYEVVLSEAMLWVAS